jgi:hypothetical protein
MSKLWIGSTNVLTEETWLIAVQYEETETKIRLFTGGGIGCQILFKTCSVFITSYKPYKCIQRTKEEFCDHGDNFWI